MSDPLATVAKDIEIGAADALHFLLHIKTGLGSVAPEVITAALALLQTAITAATSTESAAAAGGVNLALDAQAWADVKLVVANFSGDLKKLGIKL